MIDIHAIILTFNEEKHIARCIRSIKGQCATVTIIDCHSSDQTVQIARELGAKVLVNKWINYASQMKFGIDALAGEGGWLLRIDADEVLDADSKGAMVEAIERAEGDVDGLLIRRRIHFLGRRIKYGAIEPSWQLRLWRNGAGRCEQRWMDEHIMVDGRVMKSTLVLSDINLNSLAWWTDKHNSYASREAIDILNQRFGFLASDNISEAGASGQAKLKRLIKERIYLKIPGGVRALLYFLYRYVLRLGFLDGKPGYYFHLMQGFWYRTLVDAKVMEIIQFAKSEKVTIIEAIKDRTGIDPVFEQIADMETRQLDEQ